MNNDIKDRMTKLGDGNELIGFLRWARTTLLNPESTEEDTQAALVIMNGIMMLQEYAEVVEVDKGEAS